SELLSFLATGTPSGQPPFALLANVSVTNVPEPAAWTVMVSGLVGLIGIARRRRPGPVNEIAA
ncbi:MAG: PEP-CTERM sorting domain-containing protein, partial [Rhodopila sp.]|nr:PEP-CTERM sorting domain-containing protein [Rhodopila sp.]